MADAAKERGTGTLCVVDASGVIRRISAAFGRSVMEILKDHDLVPGICGGCCSCASCHVFVEPAWRTACPVPSADERDLIEGLSAANGASRLSCQIPFKPTLDGITLTVAPED